MSDDKQIQFARYSTAADIHKLHEPAARDAQYSQWIQELICEFLDSTEERAAESMIEIFECHSEYLLYKSGRPYYKIYPDFVTAMMQTRLDVPSEHFRMPFPAWEIRLPLGMLGTPRRYIKTILVCDSSVVTQPGPLAHPHLNALFDADDGAMSRPYSQWVFEEMGIPIERQGCHVELLALYYDEEAMPEHDHSAIAKRRIVFDKALTIQESMERTRAGDEQIMSAAEIARNNEFLEIDLAIWKIVVTLSFLITGRDRIIEPDLLAKDLAKLGPETPQADIDRLHERAVNRRGEGRGYTVGRRERILRLATERSDEYAASGRELKFSHLRCGHLHGYHTNRGYIVKWIPMLTVRPELPPNPEGRAGVLVK